VSNDWYDRVRERRLDQLRRQGLRLYYASRDWTETVSRSACYDNHTYLMLNGLHPAYRCECDPTPRREFKT
jgi:hypothetical protein